MSGTSLHLFRIFGFDVRVHASWFLLFIIVAASLSLGYFPARFPELPPGAYLWMGVAGALGLFLSIVAHELCHSLIALRFGLRMQGITLFLFGGVAEMPEEPKRPAAEFWMAAAGPAASVALAALFHGLFLAAVRLRGLPATGAGILEYLSVVNLILAAFNLVPAFPLDGGRMLRAAVWAATGNAGKSTRIASGLGSAFGWLLLLFGAFRIAAGDLFGGIWSMLLGWFIQTAARSSAGLNARADVLRGETLRRLLHGDPPGVAPELPLRRWVEEYLYPFDYPFYPVLREGKAIGCIGLRQVKALSPERIDALRVDEVMIACPEESLAPADTPMDQALRRMREGGRTALAVQEGERVIGMVKASDILRFASLRIELERTSESGKDAKRGRETLRSRLPPGEPLPA